MDQPVTVQNRWMLRGQPVRDWLPLVVLLLYLVVALGLVINGAARALDRKLPAPARLSLSPSLVVIRSAPFLSADLQAGDRILSVNGVPVKSRAEWYAALRNTSPEAELTVQVLRNNETLSLRLSPAQMKVAQTRQTFFAALLVGLVYWVAAAWMFWVRRGRASGRWLAFFFLSVSVACAGLVDWGTVQRFVPFWLLSLALAGGAAVGVTLHFPREDVLLYRMGWIRWAVFLPGLAAFGLAVQGYLQSEKDTFSLGFQGLILLLAISALFALGWMLFRRQRVLTPVEREQLRHALLSGVVGFTPLVLYWILSLFRPMDAPSALVLLPLVIFPVVIGYTIQRYRLTQTEFIISRALLYGGMAVLIAVGYALLVSGLSLITGQVLNVNQPVLLGLVFFILALVFVPLRNSLQHAVDAVFFRGQQVFQERLQTFSGELTRAVELKAILNILRRYLEEALTPARLHIFVYDALSDQYVATATSDGKVTSDLRFAPSSPLVQMLVARRGPVMYNDQESIPVAMQAERARIELLGATLFIPLPGRERLSGWVVLGERVTGEPYTPRELGFAEALCDQAALAIERAQVLANMENRVRQMNVLTRVAQGVNVTPGLDDILELIYAQTSQIITCDEFRIMLHDEQNDTFTYAFYLEQDERISARENKPVPAGQALEQEVIRLQRSIRTDDYNREVQRRGVGEPRPGVFACLVVPLNTGARTIGAMSLFSHDPRVEYTPEQENLAQSIANQVAGAIVKARLLEETERRALQLTTLNEMTRQLTSTLELEPLLQNILRSAVDILSCDAGSLLLIDEATEELVFRVVVSPVANTLLNRRLPPGKGVVGQAVKSRQPIIVNDVSKYPEWFSQTDRQTGYFTRALLAIPLMVKDKVIGVIEVINKKDGSPFTRDDQDLLSAFAAQAAVAIENARLYTMTDQALAERVEELSIMQRIDRELNTSLDTTRAMRTTLEWAMRRSGAQAGLIGVLQENGLRIMASQGYTDELEPFQNAPLPLDEYNLDDALREAIPMRRSLTEEDGARLLRHARSQILIPIRRETNTIGVILLESTSPELASEEVVDFLSRLSDHASIAIFNAQLYQAVQNANLAKSEFVSFVAHELKNPMTSVKGYTELLAAGAVGPVNDAQANFLNTIRANIERMNTLVSDLNDLSKIEVGRLRLEFKAVSLAEVVEGVVRSTRRQIDEKKQTLEISIPSDLPPAWADRTRLEQVLVNLVSNAHKYTPQGGHILVAAERARNIWNPEGVPEVIHVWVKDDGIGISEEDQKKIFQKFFRSEDPKTREVPGTGLGLNITKSLVEMQGGTIWFESEFRKGTTFHFTVPISQQ
ncbi:GAF domain-containing protein [Anaerolinea thermophila]|uniref:GAF domain-containing protein n=4 Tax=Anaerolinea TaxID=233189 RepID=UPI0026EC2662|nr:GAF domain-containing protein [Anaerolinea thermophila]